MYFLFILVVSFGIIVPTASASVITAAQSPWPPFINDDDANPGLVVEIVTAAYQTQGYELQFNVLPWLRALKSAKTTRIDVIPALWYTRKRSKHYLYSDAYLVNEITFVKRASDPFKYSGVSSLDGKKVGVIGAYHYDSVFLSAQNVEKITADRLMVNLKRLISGHIDLAVSDRIVASHTIKQSSLPASHFAFSDTSLSTTPLYLAISVHHPNAQRYVDAFNQGLAEIKRNGQLRRIEVKYGID